VGCEWYVEGGSSARSRFQRSTRGQVAVSSGAPAAGVPFHYTPGRFAGATRKSPPHGDGAIPNGAELWLNISSGRRRPGEPRELVCVALGPASLTTSYRYGGSGGQGRWCQGQGAVALMPWPLDDGCCWPHPGFATPLPLSGRGELGGVCEVAFTLTLSQGLRGERGNRGEGNHLAATSRFDLAPAPQLLGGEQLCLCCGARIIR